MEIIFKDENMEIHVQNLFSSPYIDFFSSSAIDIIPALHFFDTYPNLTRKDVCVRKISHLPSNSLRQRGVETEVYCPHLIQDSKGHTFSYQNYHFIFLREGHNHGFLEVLRGYADFIYNMDSHAPRKIKIKDVDDKSLDWLRKIAQAKSGSQWFEHNRRAYAYYSSSSPGLANRLGLGKTKLRDSLLNERINL